METVITTVEIHRRMEPLVSEWERLADHLNASPFLWPGWMEAWGHAFGGGHHEILAVYQNGRLAGILPLRRLGNGLSSTANAHTPFFGFLAANAMAAEKLAQALFSQAARRVDLSFLLSEDPGLSLARAAGDAAGYRELKESGWGLPYVTIDGTSWDAYEKGLAKNHRGDARRQRRRLEKKGHLTLDVRDGTEGLNELLEEGFGVEGSGWKDAEGTSIKAQQATHRFYTEVARWASERGWLRLAFLRLDGQALAFDFCLECNKVHYLLKTGYDPVYANFSPGKVLRYLMLARAFSESLATYELLGLLDPWKQKWTSAYRERHSLHIFAPTVLGFLDSTVYMSGRLASKHARSLVQSPIFPERGYRLLKQVHRAWHR